MSHLVSVYIRFTWGYCVSFYLDPWTCLDTARALTAASRDDIAFFNINPLGPGYTASDRFEFRQDNRT